MNKQEAIKRIEQMGEYERFVDEPISKGSVLNIISQIHEPQKVVVPKFIGDLIEELKIDEYTIGEIGACVYDDEEQKWIDDNEEQFYRAFLDGFVIEQEKLYTVEIPNPNRTTEPIIYLSRDEGGKIFLNTWFLHVSQTWKKQPHARLTESEIKQDFEWAWDAGFAKKVEVKND